MIQLLLWIGLSIIAICSSNIRFSHGGARRRFELKFNQTCLKYDFVRQYIDSLEHPRDKYVIFVYHEAGHSGGGLGDRLGGMITALAFALRTNRTLLIQGDSSFEESFVPYHPRRGHGFTWKNWDWAKWDRSYASNMIQLKCVNPRPGARHCALDVNYWDEKKVIKYYGNRAYLCRWMIKPSLGLGDEIKKHLQIERSTDLYEIGGCLLRLAIWPTEKLWNALDDSLEPQFRHRNSAHIALQIGFHFRCGDSSFIAPKPGEVRTPNPECYYNESLPWKGTVFMDDKSIDSPVDEATCGRELLYNESMAEKRSGKAHNNIIAYIASDNIDSSNQINSTLGWDFTIKPPQGCHVDLQTSDMCTLTTSLHWFMLGLSDHIIMQGLIKPEHSMFDNSPETAHLSHLEQPAPISAFSRFAAVYSLGEDSIRYGKGCYGVNRTLLSQQSHGNWVCDPRTFY